MASSRFDALTTLFPVQEQFGRKAKIPVPRRPSLLTMKEGWAKQTQISIDGQSRVLGFFLPGETRVVADLGPDLGDVEITALTPARAEVMVMDEATIPSNGVALIRHAANDAVVAARWIARLGKRSPFERIADLMHEIAVRQNMSDAEPDRSTACPLTQYDIAGATGITAIHVNRMLRELRDSGLLRLSRGKLEIPSLRDLRRAGHGDYRDRMR